MGDRMTFVGIRLHQPAKLGAPQADCGDRASRHAPTNRRLGSRRNPMVNVALSA